MIRSMNAKNLDVMIPINKMTYVTEDDSLFIAIQFFDKKKIDEIPVLSNENKFIGFFTKEMVFKCLLKNVKINTQLLKLPITFKKCKSFAKKSDMYDINKGITFITDNGKSTGIVIGVVE